MLGNSHNEFESPQMSSSNDSFSWLDDIIIQYKANYCKKETYTGPNNSIERILKENLELKSRIAQVNDIIKERDRYKELSDLKEKEIQLLEAKIKTLSTIKENNSNSELPFLEKLKTEINDLYLRTIGIIQECVSKKIDIKYESNSNVKNGEYYLELVKDRIGDIDNMMMFLKEQNNQYKELILTMQRKEIEMKNNIYSNNFETEYSNVDNVVTEDINGIELKDKKEIAQKEVIPYKDNNINIPNKEQECNMKLKINQMKQNISGKPKKKQLKK